MTCERCDGAEVVPVRGGMARCPECGPEPLTCRGVACLDPFRCNVAGRCSLPAPEWRVEGLGVGESITVPHDQADAVQRRAYRYAERTGYAVQFATRTLPEGRRIWRLR